MFDHLLTTKEIFFENCGHIAGGILIHMGVDGQCYAGIGVAQATADGSDGDALMDKVAGVRVP